MESKFLAGTSPDEIKQIHRYLTAQPHPAGSPRNNDLAQWIAALWTRQGLEDVTIHEYDVYSSALKSISLEMLAPVKFAASLHEDAYPQDPSTTNHNVDRAFLAYSASGEVTASVIYANLGEPADYELLHQMGVSVTGQIVIVRRGNPGGYGGFKAQLAEQEGAAAILLYTDPMDDGYRRGKVFPFGPWAPASAIQRGSMIYDFLQPGDPTTPGWPSNAGAKRIAPADARTLPRIIGVPLSWRDAKPLLENMDGPAAPKAWQGALPIIYHLGGERVRVHLKVEMENSIKPYYDVEARIRGSEFPEETVILGGHRDAWVYGGADPSSGAAALLELTQDMGALLKQGMRPRRTLIFCSWDGGEQALTGSTEWGEQYDNELKRQAVAYLNVDSSVTGPDLHGSATGSLAQLLVDASHDVIDPSGRPLYESWKTSRGNELNRKSPISDDELADMQIGGRSDHIIFVDNLGIPVILLRFEGPSGVRHTMYDDFFWMNHFGDPGYRCHEIASQLWGIVALRLANADVLPYDFASSGRSIVRFLQDLDQRTGLGQHVRITSLVNAISDFQAAGVETDGAVVDALKNGAPPAVTLRKVNSEMMQVERNWLDPAGLPGRPWFKNSLYSVRNSYEFLGLPGLALAAESSDWAGAQSQAALLQMKLETNTDLLRLIQNDLRSAGPASPAK
jgi:N-acetylated-alpha-linked acidic dipeptidase